MLAACCDCGGGSDGGGGMGLCLWAKTSNGPGIVCSNLIEKNLLAVKMICKKRKRGDTLTCTHGHCLL